MEVWVDGQSNFRVEGAPEDLLTVFRAAADFLRARGRMPVEVVLNGQNIFPSGLLTALEGAPATGAGRLEIQSADIRGLVNDSLAKLGEAAGELPAACRQLAEIFQSDTPGDGFETFEHVAELWGHVKEHERMVANALELDLTAAAVNGQSLDALSEDLNGFLEEAERALERGDAIALGDLLEYELAPRAENESAIVAWLKERAAALPA